MSADEDAAELSPLERRLWAGQQLAPDSPLYNMGLVGTVRGALDPERFARAWLALQRLFPSIARSVEVDTAGEARWRRHAPAPIVRLDLSAETDPAAACRALLAAETARPFAPGATLSECRLVRLGEACWTIHLKQHHVLTDARSFQILWERLDALYRDESAPDDVVAHPAPDACAPVRASSHASTGTAPARPFGATARSGTTRAPRRPLVADAARRAALASLSALPEARSFGTELSRAVVLLSVFAAYLARVAATRRVAIGLSTDLRGGALEAVPGLFVEVRPLVVELDEGERFAALAAKVRAALLEHLRGAGEAGDGGVASVAATFNYVTARLGDFAAMPSEVEWLHSGHADREHAVRLHVSDWNGRGDPTLELDLNAEVYRGDRAEHVATHWWALFDAFAADPHAAVDAVDLVVGAEREAVLELCTDPAWAVAERREGRATLVLDRFDAQRVRTPAAIAVREGDRTLDYATLGELTERVARALVALGVGPGARVALRMPRSIEFVAAVLGTLRAGAAYLPLPLDAPPARAAWIVSDADAALLVGEALPEASAGIEAVGWEALLEADGAAGAAAVASIARPIEARSLAHTFYTSGSSGVPKGVDVSHGALANYVGWACDLYAAERAPTFPLFTPIGFDMILTSLFVPLLTGGTVRVYRESERGEAAVVLRVFADDAVDVIKLTPSHLALVADRELTGSRLRRVVTGGEALRRALAARVHRALGGRVPIDNMYGPTETTVGCTVHTFVPDEDTGADVPIGRPGAGMRARVLNEALRLQPQGVGGELCVDGPSLAEGYKGDERATRAAFVTDPLDGERLYRTGDLVRLDDRGRLVYLGRLDGQVKIGGTRVELAEVEAAALAVDGIGACVASAFEVDGAGEALVLHYVAPGGLDARRLRAELRERLPRAMVPASLVPIERLPLNASGKVDRDALPRPSGDLEGTRTVLRAPSTPTERWLGALWCELLLLERVDVDDDWFELGGESLSAIRLVARVAAAGYDCAVSDLFREGSVSALAACLDRRGTRAQPEAEPTAAAPSRPAFGALGAGELDRLAAALDRASDAPGRSVP